MILACLLKNGGNLGGEGGPSFYIELILDCLLNMGETEKGREVRLLTDLILACLLNMGEIEERREAHPHIVLILAWPPFVTGTKG